MAILRVADTLSKTNRANVFGKKKQQQKKLRFPGCPYFKNIHETTLNRIFKRIVVDVFESKSL